MDERLPTYFDDPDGPPGRPELVRGASTKHLLSLIDQMVRATFPVLVLGETGVGKENIAGEVHARSARSTGPFVSLNCASIPESLVDSILFGHERGAFTGASERRIGVFERAHHGTLFLDEIGELNARTQAALLRALETRRIIRVGGTKEIGVDARIVSATHRDLTRMTSEGAFREDLLFRLNTMVLRIAPLRERRDEIEELSLHFLDGARRRWSTIPASVEPAALALLMAFDWPGNVRQLKNVLEQAAVMCRSQSITPNDLPDLIKGRGASAQASIRSNLPYSARLTDTEPQLNLPERIRMFESQLVREALLKAGGSHAKAAALLGIPRRTLSSKIQTLNIESVTATS